MMKLIVWTLALGGLSFIAGCATTPSGDFCDIASPIRPSVSDTLTDGTAEQILKHNRFGAQACGWKGRE